MFVIAKHRDWIISLHQCVNIKRALKDNWNCCHPQPSRFHLAVLERFLPFGKSRWILKTIRNYLTTWSMKYVSYRREKLEHMFENLWWPEMIVKSFDCASPENIDETDYTGQVNVQTTGAVFKFWVTRTILPRTSQFHQIRSHTAKIRILPVTFLLYMTSCCRDLSIAGILLWRMEPLEERIFLKSSGGNLTQ